MRRRRHVKVAVGAALLCVVAAVLLLVDRGTGSSRTDVDQACVASNEHLATLSNALLGGLADGVDPAEAFTGFLQHAFVDFLRQRADEIDALEPPADVAALVAEWRSTADAIAADPSSFVSDTNPFADLNDRWAQAGLPDCAIAAATVPSDAGAP